MSGVAGTPPLSAAVMRGGRVLELLREHGAEGVHGDYLLYVERIPDYAAQIAALRGMGHAIRQVSERRPGAPPGHPALRFFLVRDAEDGAPAGASVKPRGPAPPG